MEDQTYSMTLNGKFDMLEPKYFFIELETFQKVSSNLLALNLSNVIPQSDLRLNT